jgi:hypothetical protein
VSTSTRSHHRIVFLANAALALALVVPLSAATAAAQSWQGQEAAAAFAGTALIAPLGLEPFAQMSVSSVEAFATRYSIEFTSLGSATLSGVIGRSLFDSASEQWAVECGAIHHVLRTNRSDEPPSTPVA